MASTRLKVSNQAVLYHRFAASNDAPQTDVGTSEALASKLGSIGDFQLLASDTMTMTEQNKVIPASDTELENVSSPKLIWIKNSGYQEAAKTNSTASTVLVATGGTSVNAITSLSPDQSILLTAPFGSGLGNLSDVDLKSSSGSVFCEVIAVVDAS